MPSLTRPGADEYAEFYAGYVSLVPETDVLPALDEQVDELGAICRSVSPERESYRYQPGKWSVREMIGHIGDAERVFGYRAFCFSRGEQQPLPGFDEKVYVAASGFDVRPLASLFDEWAALRRVNLTLLRGLDEKAWTSRGTAFSKSVSVRALAYIMAGHVRHHMGVLASRYGIPASPGPQQA